MEIIKNGSWLEIAENVNIEMTCGALKGWVLGPSLWNLYYDDVFRLRIPMGTELISYADDLVMVVSAKDVPTLIRNTEQAALRIEECLRSRGLQMAEDKTKLVIFAGRR